MSGLDQSDGSSSPPDDSSQTDDVCRDFLRNVCRRGVKCKFRHPEGLDAIVELGKRVSQDIQFCHDFQNTGSCKRTPCRFLHCSREEEETFRQTGKLPAHAASSAAIPPVTPGGAPPVCKDYLKGECHRGARCKFRHLAPAEYEAELTSGKQINQSVQPLTASAVPNQFVSSGLLGQPDDEFGIAIKRRRIEVNPDFRPCLEEENLLLRSKIAELKKQVSDLAAANEVLLDQNARYRNAGLISCKTRALQPPVVSVSHVLTPTVTPAPSILQAPTAQPPLLAAGPPILSAKSDLVVPAGARPTLSQAPPIFQHLETGPTAIAAPPPTAQPLSLSTSLNSTLVSYPIMSKTVG